MLHESGKQQQNQAMQLIHYFYCSLKLPKGNAIPLTRLAIKPEALKPSLPAPFCKVGRGLEVTLPKHGRPPGTQQSCRKMSMNLFQELGDFM